MDEGVLGWISRNDSWDGPGALSLGCVTLAALGREDECWEAIATTAGPMLLRVSQVRVGGGGWGMGRRAVASPPPLLAPMTTASLPPSVCLTYNREAGARAAREHGEGSF